jgi:hypothetical protein
MLSHPPAQIIARLIVDLGVGALPSTSSSVTWPTYVSKEPTSPDNVMTVYDTTPVSDGRVMDGESQYHYGFQLRIRGVNYSQGWTKASAVHSAFDSMYEKIITIDGTRYLVHSVVNNGGILSLGNESPESKRELFTLNALTTITQL